MTETLTREDLFRMIRTASNIAFSKGRPRPPDLTEFALVEPHVPRGRALTDLCREHGADPVFAAAAVAKAREVMAGKKKR